MSNPSVEATSLRQTLRQRILTLSTESASPNRRAFGSLALDVFRYQAVFNPVYGAYLRHLSIQPEQITDLRRVPFMPIGFFKHHPVLSGFGADYAMPSAALTFVSSGTTSRPDQMPTSAGTPEQDRSRHIVPDPDLYDAISTRIFEQIYGPLRDFHILALLPSYLERNNSSLVYMVQRFMARTNSEKSGFFLQNHAALTHRLRALYEAGDGAEPQKRILLIGVTFGLLDWAESGPDLSFLGQIPNLIVMETGGMKGRRRELLREEVHQILRERLGIATVHSEYGMTELLSQAYSTGDGLFRPGPTLRVFLRDVNDPFLLYPDDFMQTGERRTGSHQTGERRTGGINVVDLANLDSCAFVETGDLGQYADANGGFRVIGRFDNSDVRGCNLLVVSE